MALFLAEEGKDMAQQLKTYKLGYQKCNPPYECWVRDSKIKFRDFDGTVIKLSEEIIDPNKKNSNLAGSSRNLFEGTYSMGSISSRCLIQKFQNKESLVLYPFLKDVRHPNIISAISFYEDSGYPRYVLSWVDGSLTGWLRKEGSKKIFKSTMKGSAPTGATRQMIMELQHLLDCAIYPKKISKEDIYVCQFGQKTIAKLLVRQVDKLTDPLVIKVRKEVLWTKLSAVLLAICKNAAGTLDPSAEKFLNSIGVNSITKLQNYPDLWDYNQKASYLLSVMSENINVVFPKVQGVGIQWPENANGQKRSPFREMLEHEANTPTPGVKPYNNSEPYDYLRLCKHMIKHWRFLPASVKAECSTIEKLIAKMEQWNHLIWCILYDATS